MKNNKIIIGLVLAVIALAGMYVALAATADYTLTVSSAQNTALTGADGAFGSVIAGATDTIDPTFTLTNTGNAAATVNAKFTTVNETIYGMSNDAGTEEIPGTAFELKKSAGGTFAALAATNADTPMTDTVATGAGQNWAIEVNVPAGQVAAAYHGTIQLTFS